MIVIGVTGNLASGKSETVKLFKKKGAVVFNADVAAKRALDKGTAAHMAVVKIFGKEYAKPNGEIDRKKLAWRVFSNPKELNKLNILIHPGVIFDCLKVISRCRNKKGMLVLDVPLLFESHMQNLADVNVVVAAKRETMLDRSEKKGMPRKLAAKILASQWSMGKKARMADHVINNEGSLKDLEKRVDAILAEIKGGAPKQV